MNTQIYSILCMLSLSPFLSMTCTQDFEPSNGGDGSHITTCTDTLPTTDAQKGVVSVQTIAGSVIGSCIVLLLLIVASVLLVVCLKRRKKIKKSRDNEVDLSINLINPVYVPRGEQLHTHTHTHPHTHTQCYTIVSNPDPSYFCSAGCW